MKRLDSANMLAGPAQLEISPGQWAAFGLRVSGTNAGGATLAAANLGRVTAKFQGRPFASLGFDDLQILNMMDLGLVEAASAIGAAFAFTAVIQASRVNDGNIFDIQEQDNATIELDLAGLGALVAAGTVELFGIPQDGSAAYIPQLFSFTPNIAAGTVYTRNLPYENISHVYVTVPTNLASIQLVKDGQLYVDEPWASLIAFSNMDCRIEAAFVLGARVTMHRSGAITEALTDACEVILTAAAGGASTPHIICVSNDFVPTILSRSSATAQQKAISTFNRKAHLGKGRALTVAQAITGSLPK